MFVGRYNFIRFDYDAARYNARRYRFSYNLGIK